MFIYIYTCQLGERVGLSFTALLQTLVIQSLHEIVHWASLIMCPALCCHSVGYQAKHDKSKGYHFWTAVLLWPPKSPWNSGTFYFVIVSCLCSMPESFRKGVMAVRVVIEFFVGCTMHMLKFTVRNSHCLWCQGPGWLFLMRSGHKWIYHGFEVLFYRIPWSLCT